MEIIIVGRMDHTMDKTFESSNRVYGKDGLSPTIPTCAGGGTQPKVMDISIAEMKQQETACLGGLGQKKSNGGTQFYQQDRVYSMGDVAMCHPANIPSVSYLYLETKAEPSCKIKDWKWKIDDKAYTIRIRKLTPRECWRLMDFSDADFEKAESVCSSTQLYRQAGNSICRNVLCEIFKKLL